MGSGLATFPGRQARQTISFAVISIVRGQGSLHEKDAVLTPNSGCSNGFGGVIPKPCICVVNFLVADLPHAGCGGVSSAEQYHRQP